VPVTDICFLILLIPGACSVCSVIFPFSDDNFQIPDLSLIIMFLHLLRTQYCPCLAQLPGVADNDLCAGFLLVHALVE
jgi:hypothetical protein